MDYLTPLHPNLFSEIKKNLRFPDFQTLRLVSKEWNEKMRNYLVFHVKISEIPNVQVLQCNT